MANYGVEVNGKDNLGSPLYYLAAILDIYVPPGKTTNLPSLIVYNTITGGAGYSPDSVLYFMKFRGTDYSHDNARIHATKTAFYVNANSKTTYDTGVIKGDTFWDLKIYVYASVPEKAISGPDDYGISIWDGNNKLNMIISDTHTFSYAKNFKIGNQSASRLYLSNSYKVTGRLRYFNATDKNGNLVEASIDNANVALRNITHDRVIVSIDPPTIGEENAVISNGRYITIR
jgi:hypothetical protein